MMQENSAHRSPPHGNAWLRRARAQRSSEIGTVPQQGKQRNALKTLTKAIIFTFSTYKGYI